MCCPKNKPPYLPRARRGFTLIEMLVVIAIIILAMTLAIPAIRSLTGSRSQEAAENTLSGALRYSRGRALRGDRWAGMLFILDDDDLVKGYVVEEVDVGLVSNAVPGWVYLDVSPDIDPISLPRGIRLRTMYDSVLPVQYPIRLSQPFPRVRYMGYNPPLSGGPARVGVGGVILFNHEGQLVPKCYGFHLALPNGDLTAIGQVIYGQSASGIPQVWPQESPSVPYTPSSVGLVLYDKEASGLPDANDPTTISANQWLDNNATPIFVNRYDGTLMRAE